MLKSPENLGIIHFIGIGGIGMSGIAEILHQSGYYVQGSDINESNNTNWENEIPAKNNIAITKAPITKVDPRSGWDKINNPKIAKTNKGLKKPNEVLISPNLLTQYPEI